MTTVNEQLAQAIKAAEDAAKKVDELKKQTRDADLETVKTLIKTHGFGPTDLRGVLKAKRKRSKTGTAAKKTTGTPRKSPAAKKTKK
jgi:hypothetical protein